MNSQFHTPSLGDGFDLSGVEETAANAIDSHTDTQTVFQQSQTDHFESKRMQGMEQSMSLSNASVADINNYPVGNANTGSGASKTGTSGIFNITAHLNNNFNSNATNNQNHTPPTTMAARKQLSPSGNDPNEPAKPLSSYTLFFRDTVSVIKQQNPNCTFEELNRIVSSMWEALDPAQKAIYNEKTEAARNEYVKQYRIYKQQNSRNDGQSVIMLNTDASSNLTNANNSAQDQFSPGKESPVTLPSSEIQMTTPQTAANVTLDEGITNSQSTNHMQETVIQQIPTAAETHNTELCIRDGCNKRAIMNPDWEDEYCSNECVVIHCRNVFNDWVQQNKEAASLQP